MKRGVLLSASGRVLVTVTGASTTVAAGRILGPSGFGAFSVALTMVVVLQVLATLGVEHGIVYYVSSRRWHPGQAFWSSQGVACLSGLAAVCLAVVLRVIAPRVFHGLTLAETVMAAASLPFALSWFYGGYLALAVGDYRGYVLPTVIQSSALLALMVGLALWRGIEGAVLALVLAHLLTAVVRFPAIDRLTRSSPARERSSSGMLIRAACFGAKGTSSTALQAINVRLDTFILNATAASAVVGHYALAVSITGLITLLPRALSDILYPRAAALSSTSSREDAAALLTSEEKSLRHGAIATVAAALGCALGLVLLVVPVFGSQFHPSVALGLVLLPGVAAFGMGSIFASAIVGRGRPDVTLLIMLIVTPATIALYFLLIPRFHAMGAALASTASYSSSLILLCVCYKRLSGRSALGAMMPTRSDFADYVDLALGTIRQVRSNASGAPASRG